MPGFVCVCAKVGNDVSGNFTWIAASPSTSARPPITTISQEDDHVLAIALGVALPAAAILVVALCAYVAIAVVIVQMRKRTAM